MRLLKLSYTCLFRTNFFSLKLFSLSKLLTDFFFRLQSWPKISINHNEISKEIQQVEAFQSQPFAKSAFDILLFATDFRVVKPAVKEMKNAPSVLLSHISTRKFFRIRAREVLEKLKKHEPKASAYITQQCTRNMFFCFCYFFLYIIETQKQMPLLNCSESIKLIYIFSHS